jgi:phage-related protein
VPPTRLVLYRNDDGSVPLLQWLEELSPRARAKCRVRLERLAQLGHELRRPEADTLRDGIHDLRAKDAGVNLRILYFFHGRRTAVLTQGFTKQRSQVPTHEIGIAVRRKAAFEADPLAHEYEDERGRG